MEDCLTEVTADEIDARLRPLIAFGVLALVRQMQESIDRSGERTGSAKLS